MITRDGVDWLTADEIAHEIGKDITPAILWDWKRRGLVRAATIGAGRSRAAHYRCDDVQEAELATRLRPGGRPRRGVVTVLDEDHADASN